MKGCQEMIGPEHPAGVRRDILSENLRQASVVIRTHKLRSFLLILGVAIGITTILGMVTVLSGLGRKINKDLVSASRPYLIIQRFDLFVSGVDEEEMIRRKEFEPEDADLLRRSCPSLDNVCFFISPSQAMRLNRKARKTQPLQVVGASYTMPSIYSLEIENGRFYSEVEANHRKRFIVLGYGPAKDLFPHENPIGKFVRVEGKPYKVVGTFAKRKHFIGAMSDNFAVIPSATYYKDLKLKYDETSMSANVKEGHTLAEGESEITNVLRIRRGVRPGQDNNFVVLTSEAFLEMIGKVTFYIGLVLIIIASIGLIVGGIGVMNIMLISVTERTREIGVRRAIGARRHDIIQQVLIESSVLTGIGGVVGTVLGLGFAYLISLLIRFPFYFSIPWMVISLLFSAAIGIIFGIYPAHRASKLDPVEALRYE
jgi:putative ABC transport system permease protein